MHAPFLYISIYGLYVFSFYLAKKMIRLYAASIRARNLSHPDLIPFVNTLVQRKNFILIFVLDTGGKN